MLPILWLALVVLTIALLKVSAAWHRLHVRDWKWSQAYTVVIRRNEELAQMLVARRLEDAHPRLTPNQANLYRCAEDEYILGQIRNWRRAGIDDEDILEQLETVLGRKLNAAWVDDLFIRDKMKVSTTVPND